VTREQWECREADALGVELNREYASFQKVDLAGVTQ